MKKTIYNVYVLMESQKQCDRMKQLCIYNELPYWEADCAFKFTSNENVFAFDNSSFFEKTFFVYASKRDCKKFTQVTETEFIKLLEKEKNGKLESRD